MRTRSSLLVWCTGRAAVKPMAVVEAVEVTVEPRVPCRVPYFVGAGSGATGTAPGFDADEEEGRDDSPTEAASAAWSSASSRLAKGCARRWLMQRRRAEAVAREGRREVNKPPRASRRRPLLVRNRSLDSLVQRWNVSTAHPQQPPLRSAALPATPSRACPDSPRRRSHPQAPLLPP